MSPSNIFITKRDGQKEIWNADKINRSIERACKGLSDPVAMVVQVATDTRLMLYDGITTYEMDRATIDAAVQNIKNDTEYDKIAVRLLLKTIYRKVIGEYNVDDIEDLKQKHRDGFINYVKKGITENRLHPNMLEKFDLDKIANALNIGRDEIFIYSGLDTLMNRYSIKNTNQDYTETPQYLFMRVAMGLSYNEADPTEWAIRFYEKMSRHHYIAAGSTNLGAGTVRSSL